MLSKLGTQNVEALQKGARYHNATSRGHCPIFGNCSVP